MTFRLKDFDVIQLPATSTKLDWLAAVCCRVSELEGLSSTHNNVNDSTPAPIKKRKLPSANNVTDSMTAPIKKRRIIKKKFEEQKVEIQKQYNPGACDQKENKKPRLKLVIKLNKEISISPDLRESFLNKITELSNGAITSWDQMQMVIKKNLYNTDVNSNHNRLSIPLNQITCDVFLTEDEKHSLHSYNERNKCNILEVNLLQPSLEQIKVSLSRWEMNTCWIYVLKGQWKDVVKKNGLKAGMDVELWAFRVLEELQFALLTNP